MAEAIFVPSYKKAKTLVDDVSVTDIRLTKLNKKVALSFSLSWLDSWRFAEVENGPKNWDAVWVFVKLSASNRMRSFPTYWPGNWGPAHFETDANSYLGPVDSVIAPAEDGLGFFVYRRAPGRGPVSFRGIAVTFADDTAQFIAESEELDVAVMAIRMVYIPEGPFWVGDPTGVRGPTNCFYAPESQDTSNLAYQVASEAAIDIGKESGQLYYKDNGYGGDQKGPIPAEFPKGTEPFYIMRDHVTQSHYARFINLLPSTAKTIRYPYLGEGAFRFTIYTDRSGNRTATRGRRPCNYLSWADGTAYADWAALRPMTELEFTKACRGLADPVEDEFAWGNTCIELAQIILGHESVESVVSGNCNIGNANVPFDGGDGGQGPVRSDVLLMQGAPDAVFFFKDHELYHDPTISRIRQESGVSYYGVMGLSGNLWEYAVSVGSPEGRAFTGKHGNGNLDSSGSPDYDDLCWPGVDCNGVGFRGGSWYTDEALGRVADRSYGGGLPGYIFRSHDTGFRCARTAPADAEE